MSPVRSPQDSSLAPLLAERIDNDPARVQEIKPPFQPAADAALNNRAVVPAVMAAPPILKYTTEERRLAGLARAMPMNQSVLYHGTRYARSILRTGVLLASDPGDRKVSLTRSPEVAAYFALLPRDDGEERGAILIFDRERLQCRHRIYPLEDSIVEIWNSHDEAEEELRTDLTDVSSYLVGFVSEPPAVRSDKVKRLNCRRRIDLEGRLDDVLCFIPDWRCRPEEPVKSHLEQSILARTALFDGMPIEEAAKRTGLSVRAVRRLSGRLRQRVPARNDVLNSSLNWNVAEVIACWDVNGLFEKSGKLPGQPILRTELETVFGAHRTKALMAYCGLSGDDALDQLAQELRRLMPTPVDENTSPAPPESAAP